MAVAIGIIVVLVLGVVDVALRVADVDGPLPVLVAPVVAAVVVMALGLGIAQVRYRTWRYHLDTESVAARWGVITHRSAVVPRNRVQTVTTADGPIDRFLGLTTLTVHTAGAAAPNLTIPHLDDATVDWLRQELAGGAI